MAQDTETHVADELEFDYSPEQSITTEQRIEVLEADVAEMRAQLNAILELLYKGQTPKDSPWD